MEHQRYLLYLYARLNRRKIAGQLAGEILETNPSDKNSLLAITSIYVEQKNLEKALNTSHTLVQYFPDDEGIGEGFGAEFNLDKVLYSSNPDF